MITKEINISRPLQLIRFLVQIQIRPVSFSPDEVIVEQGEENPILLTYSGILKVTNRLSVLTKGFPFFQ